MPGLRFADALAAAVIADAAVAIAAESALGYATVGIADVRAGANERDVESDGDGEREPRMIARGGRNEGAVRHGWRRSVFGW